MTVRVSVSPDLLEWAVERASWDQTDIERHAPKFHEWVTGEIKPTVKQLKEFANSAHVPFGTLFLPEPPEEEIPIPDMRTIGNVIVPRPSADLLDCIYICQDRQDWYRTYAQENGLPTLGFVGSASTGTSPDIVAREIRRLLRLEGDEWAKLPSWNEAFRYLIDGIEELGVLVMVSGIVGANTHRTLEPREFRGFALSDELAPLIFANGADTKAAQIFTLIHELGHIWLGGSAISDATLEAETRDSSDSTVTDEAWCNSVAAEVLVPREDLLKEYRGEVHSAELERLARKFKVSTLVVLSRIYDAKLLSWDEYRARYDDEYDRIMAILKEKRGGSGGNFYNTQPLRVSRRFARSVVESAFEGNTLYRDAYQLLGIKKHSTFEKLAEQLRVA